MDRRPNPATPPAWTRVAATLVVGVWMPASVQAFQGTIDNEKPAPPITDPVPANDARESRFDGSLRREGSFIVAVPGTIGRVKETEGGWQFTPLEADDQPMTLLPCLLLGSMTQIAERAGAETVFELTGEVLNYRGTNYLLPTYSPRVARYAPPADVQVADDDADGAEDPQDIIERLEREVGPVPRLPAGASTTGAAPQLREGSLITWRRGWMSREADGSWVYTLAADAGGEDAALVVLPCLLLERLERLVENGGPRRPLLLSGRVYRYNRRVYLLPTAFQVPRERTPIRE